MQETESILIKYFTDKIEPLKYIGGKSDWIDLRCAEETVLKKGEMKLIPLGVAMKLPEGYEAIVVPRSSTFKNFGILQANSFGVVDESYQGDCDQWFFPALAARDTVIHVNDRICQFRILKHQPVLRFETVDRLKKEDRGGFGTTGVR
ncbi:MAG: dUTP diphosphatase [Lachnospiraceae bacterium]|nr:dUTP diphosphatase [Lachnospiraceae bacterium]